MKVHGDQWDTRNGVETCRQCGSIRPSEALRCMTTPGGKFSGTDKGGYKFYFTNEKGERGKFYGIHLADLSASELETWAEASRRCLGVDWVTIPNQPGGPDCFLPGTESPYGWQTFGRVGPDGQPVYEDGAPKPPPEEWWLRQAHRAPKS